MADNKLEFKITHDVDNNVVHLNEMSLEVAIAFVTLIQSVTKIVELTPKNKELKISVTKGSAAVSIEGTQVKSLEKSFQDIVERKSNNKELVIQWRKIQTLFTSNGIHYQANFYSDNQPISILEQLKSTKKLRTRKKERPPVESNIEFITGKLIAVGGKIPNIHVENPEGVKITISCTEGKANKAKAFLYNNIWLSIWVTKTDEKDKYEMCDSYWEQQQDIFNEFAAFIKEFKGAKNEIESLKMVHYKCQEILKKQNYGVFRKFLRLFNTDKTDLNVLKTLLIAARPFAENEKLQLLISEMDVTFGKVFEKTKRTNFLNNDF